jgi:hypothetical protein
VKENLGMVMIFTLASAALEWLNERCDAARHEKAKEAERLEREREEEEHRRFEGTRVSVETFMKWKLAFEQEFFAQKRAKLDAASKKLTGKEMFLTDKTLNESDLKFLEEGWLLNEVFVTRRPLDSNYGKEIVRSISIVHLSAHFFHNFKARVSFHLCS